LILDEIRAGFEAVGADETTRMGIEELMELVASQDDATIQEIAKGLKASPVDLATACKIAKRKKK